MPGVSSQCLASVSSSSGPGPGWHHITRPALTALAAVYPYPTMSSRQIQNFMLDECIYRGKLFILFLRFLHMTVYMTRSLEVLPQTAHSAHSVFSAVPSKWSQKWFSDQGPATFVLRPALLFCCFSLWVIFQNNWDRKIFEFDHWRPRGGEGARCIVPS